jgi:hypothetical protein
VRELRESERYRNWNLEIIDTVPPKFRNEWFKNPRRHIESPGKNCSPELRPSK